MRQEETIGISISIFDLQHQMLLKISEAIKHLGLTLPQYSALSVLENRGGITSAELARACHVSAQTMNRIVLLLEKLKLIEKEKDQNHAFKKKIQLTKKAERTVCKAHVIVNKIETQITAKLSTSELKALKQIIEKCLDATKGIKKPA